MGPSAKRKCVQPAVQEVTDKDDDNEEEEDEDQPAPQAKDPTKKGRPTTWKKIDLDNQDLPEYQHVPPDFIETPYNYFSKQPPCHQGYNIPNQLICNPEGRQHHFHHH